MRKHDSLILVFLLFIASCSRNPDLLQETLTLANENRIELEKVLQHYQINSKDSLKYKAAVFLIENMPGHYFYKDTAYINSFYNEIDSIAEIYKDLGDHEKDALCWMVIDKYQSPQQVVEDLHHITAEYLIENIEKSFDAWENGRWATHIGFDDFCEFILPYKVAETQSLDNWREYLWEYCNGDLEKQSHYSLYKNSSYYACETVNWHLRDLINPRLIPPGILPIRRMSTLLNMPFGTCEDYTTIALAMMRARGIPTAMDFTPLWAMRNLGHDWNVLLENTGKTVVFEGGGPVPGTPHKKEHKMAKVFRKTYKINEELRELNLSKEFIPKAFRNYHIMDVTTDYMVTKDIEIKLQSKISSNYAYLALFDNEKWEPIQWAKVSGKKITFKDMGRDAVYLPVSYSNGELIPLFYPILLTAGGKEIYLKPDTITKQNLILHRKFPPLNAMYIIAERTIGARIEASNDPLFPPSSTDSLFTITKYGINTEEIDLSHINKPYRYWRYLSPNGSYCNIAELFFYERDSIHASYGKVIGTKIPNNEGKDGKELVFDGDALTFFETPFANDCWVGVDFGKEVTIDKIVYMPRSDGNLIEPGDEYELVYWSESGKWESLGRQIATKIFLEYENCPSNALFLLHNHTKGKEERIFTYEEGEQRWW